MFSKENHIKKEAFAVVAKDKLEEFSIPNDLKDTIFCFYTWGGLVYWPLISSPVGIAHIKGLSYLSNYGVIGLFLEGATQREL